MTSISPANISRILRLTGVPKNMILSCVVDLLVLFVVEYWREPHKVVPLNWIDSYLGAVVFPLLLPKILPPTKTVQSTGRGVVVEVVGVVVRPWVYTDLTLGFSLE